jgi:hypothetical protein
MYDDIIEKINADMGLTYSMSTTENKKWIISALGFIVPFVILYYSKFSYFMMKDKDGNNVLDYRKIILLSVLISIIFYYLSINF